MTLEVPLAETADFQKWAKGVLMTRVVGSQLQYFNPVGLSTRSLAKQLDIIKIKNGALSVDPNDHWVFTEASPSSTQVKYTFHPSQQRLIAVVFKFWPADNTNIFGTAGS